MLRLRSSGPRVPIPNANHRTMVSGGAEPFAARATRLSWPPSVPTLVRQSQRSVEQVPRAISGSIPAGRSNPGAVRRQRRRSPQLLTWRRIPLVSMRRSGRSLVRLRASPAAFVPIAGNGGSWCRSLPDCRRLHRLGRHHHSQGTDHRDDAEHPDSTTSLVEVRVSASAANNVVTGLPGSPRRCCRGSSPCRCCQAPSGAAGPPCRAPVAPAAGPCRRSGRRGCRRPFRSR